MRLANVLDIIAATWLPLACLPAVAFPAASAAAATPCPASPFEAPLLPPPAIAARDLQGDNGGAIEIEWDLSPHDRAAGGRVTGYVVLRARQLRGPYEEIGRTPAASTRFVDSSAETGTPYFYRVAAAAGLQSALSPPAGPASPRQQWLNPWRWNVLMVGLVLAGAMLLQAAAGRRGRRFRLRRLPGVEAVGEAIARSERTGRPLLYCPGSQDLSVVQTVATLPILGEVGRLVAEHPDVRLQAPQFHPLVMAASDDVLHEVGAVTGPGGTRREDGAYYVSDEQFGYVAGVGGQMVRERPAACLYFGSFYAESLALAEVGREIDALQIAGTGQNAQIPFLLVSCDHVLIGEEMFAAAAYLGGDPRQLGVLRGQDFGKLLFAAAVTLGCLAATLAATTDSEFWRSATAVLQSVFDAAPRR